MESGRIIPGQSSPPQQLTRAQSKSGEEAFHDMAKSDGYDRGELEKAVTERTRLARTKGTRGSRSKHSLFLVKDDDTIDGEPIYRMVMVDGERWSLRLLAIA